MRSKLVLLVCFLTLPVMAFVEVKSTSANGDVQFEAIGKPSMLKIKGKGEGAVSNLKIDQGKLNGEIHFKLATLDSGIGLRDEHMKAKYLQVKENPEAILIFKDFALPATWSSKNPVLGETEFSGTLKLHGIEKPIKGTFQIEDSKLKSHAYFEIKITDFGIDIPSYLGVKVADLVKISVNFVTMSLTEVKADVKK
ncbi:MAG: YceI family protein [Pseudobdellovibrio sp.]